MVARVIWFAVLFTVAVSDSTVDLISYLWPLPQSVKCNGDMMYSISEAFTFQGTGAGGELPIVTGAFERYRKFVTPSTFKKSENVDAMTLEKLVVDVATADETLDLETDESCESRA